MTTDHLGPGGLRFLLALAVVVSHLSSIGIGTVSVMLFFMLSGYWVMRMYDRKYRLAARPVQLFLMSRFMRIWPLYFVLAILAFGIYSFLQIGMMPLHVTMLTLLGIASSGNDLLGVAWSLDIELQFYCSIPIIWVVLARTLPDWCGERPLADVAGRFLLVSVLLSLIGSALHAATGLRTALEAAPVFAAGLLLLHPTMGHVCARLATASVLAFIAFGVVAVAFDPLRPYIIKNLDPDVDTAFFNIFWAFLLVPFMARNVRLPDSPFDRHLGNLSFSLYLSHFAVIRILRDLMGGLEGPAIKGLAFLISLLVCVLIYVLLDRPFERLRSAATGRARLAPAT